MTTRQGTHYQNPSPQHETALDRIERLLEQTLEKFEESKTQQEETNRTILARLEALEISRALPECREEAVIEAHSDPTDLRGNRPHEHRPRERAPRVQNERRNWADNFGEDDEIEYPRRVPNQHDLVDQDIFRKIKIDPPTFDGHLDPKVFLEWVSAMDQFFDWHEMSEERKIRFAKMVLKGQARLFWTGVERQLARQRQPPINLWLEMKNRLMEKYLPPTHTEKLMDQLHTLRQGTTSVVEYMDKFDELMVRCDIQEDPRLTLSRFKLGLKPEIRREILPHLAGTVDQAYQLALEVEQRLQIIPFRRMGSQPTDTLGRRFSEPERSTKTLVSNPTNRQPSVSQSAINQPRESKSKAFTTESSNGSTSTKCYKCHGIGHYAYQCPTRNLFLDYEENPPKDDVEEIIYEEKDNLSEEEPLGEDQSALNVVRCLISQPEPDSDWRRTSIFHTFTRCNSHCCKIVIDGGSSMNVISKHALTKFGLTPENHPTPYNIAWVDKSSLPVTQRCLVPLQFANYVDKIWCDVLPMEVAHILLGRPWLYDLNVIHNGRANTYVFTFDGKRITLKPSQPKEIKVNSNKGNVETTTQKKHLHVLNCRPFQHETPSDSLVFAYNSSTNRSTGTSPFEIISGHQPNRPIDLIPLPPEYKPSEHAESFAHHMHELHKSIRQRISLNNEIYKSSANVHRRHYEFQVGDMVTVHVRPERFTNRGLKKLQAKRMGPFKIKKKFNPNAYELELPSDMGVSATFNIEDLMPYHSSTEPPFETSSPIPPIPTITARTSDDIEDIRDDMFSLAGSSTERRNLVKWKDRSESDCNWIPESELMRLNPDLLSKYQAFPSTELKTFEVEGNDAGAIEPTQIRRSNRTTRLPRRYRDNSPTSL